ncbi:hypothetical protein G7074_02260 [Pedobacter sp. HDW13]|uniref:hypothetical protein n=1 Tax=Pedobacter sp. HDW13 TaxID=2714940 RepID=UPI00140C2156|nr:hypothetical protein [Pedobacter sp. HDW13]QIL38200.1 hypothetical protein G7074_02260 [Pedobacter sp. HDW13]
MKNPAQYIYLIPLFISVICSWRSIKNDWAGPLKSFSIFLTFSFLLEISAVWWKLDLHQTAYWNFSKSNLWLYNLYFLPEYIFYVYFFSKALENLWLRYWAKWIAIAYATFGIINILFLQTMAQLNTFNIIFGSSIVILCSCLYFIQEHNRAVPQRVSGTPLFWISLGSLLLHSVSLPYFIFINYLSRTNIPLAMALFNILLILNISMYSIYLIAFLCKNPAPRRLF